MGTGMEETEGERVNRVAAEGDGDSRAERKVSSKLPLLTEGRTNEGKKRKGKGGRALANE